MKLVLRAGSINLVLLDRIIGSPAGQFKAELNIWHELELVLVPRKFAQAIQVTLYDATRNSGKTRRKSVTSPLTDKDHSR
jgi:hypothetical protein